MAVLKDHADAMLYLLDYMVGIDEYLDPNESKLLVKHVFSLWPGDFEQVQQKIRWVADLWQQHDRTLLMTEACALLKEHGTLRDDLHLIRKMAAIDGSIDPREQSLFDQICNTLNISREVLSLDV